MPYVDSPVTQVDNHSLRQLLELMLQDDPQKFLRACAIDNAFAVAGAEVLAVRNLGREINGHVYSPITVKKYCEAFAIADDGRGLAIRAGRLAAQAYRAHYGRDPEEVAETGPKNKTILVAGYRGVDVRFIVDALRQLGH